MPKFTVRVAETQYWYHDFEVEARSSEEALHTAESRFYEGQESEDNGLLDAVVTQTEVKLDKDFFVNITNDALRGFNVKVD
jgi:hypothetical protein